ncbi:MAG: hypothetical protein IOC52_13575 [Methylobacterium sp.]|nr:hypothetical protein [Methylobacterium sp.]MCA3608679.1 hypothetical protein [Methylobacterium sp.]MCA3616539.1 hypothetical protein [Methylobacterium sp.]MCA3620492.1 hypothetical protein [Methylobacterium sp.]MCA3625191.1 hypothetical protein [Methylobacterium sp.]
MIIIRNLKEREYPIIFGGTVHVHAKRIEGQFDDGSEITIEHIGRQ